MMNSLTLVFSLLFLLNTPSVFFAQTSPPPAATGHSLTLAETVQLVLDHHPRLKVADLEIEALSGRAFQAARRPNPEFSTTVENFAGTGAVGMSHSIETTAAISQKLESGSKRNLRLQAVQSDVTVAGKEREMLRAELLAQTTQVFAEILAAQQRLKNRQELLELALKTNTIVGDRVEAGKVSPIEQTRSAVALETAKLEVVKTEKELLAAKEKLAGFWGGRGGDFAELTGSFQLSAAAAETSRNLSPAENPELRRAIQTVESRKAYLDLEKSQGKPDVTISGGWRHFNENGDSAWVGSVSIPLPFFNRNQGGIREAQSRINQAVEEQRALNNSVSADIAETRQIADAAFVEAAALSTSILPSAQNALDSLEEGYRQGKFDYLQVLDAQRTYFELKARQIDTLLQASKAIIRIQYLTGAMNQMDRVLRIFEEKEPSHEK